MAPRPSDLNAPGAAEAIAAAGGVRESAPIPARLTAEWFRSDAARMERNLRRQYEPDDQPDFPEEWEAELAQYSPRTRIGAMRRWAYLWHLWQVRKEGLERRETEAAEPQLLAAYQLIRREPVPVRVGARYVNVTDRGLAALIEIARHQSRIEELRLDLERISEDETRFLEKAQGAPRARKKWARRYVQWLRRLRVRALAEVSANWQALFAHVFTESGAPASSRDEAPSWWDEITPAESTAIVAALVEAGPGRMARVGERPEPPPTKAKSGRYRDLERFDFLTPLTRWGVKIPVEPPGWVDKPLGQTLMFWRAAADPVWEESKGGRPPA